MLIVNPMESVYRFLDQLLTEIRSYSAVLLATFEEGMHSQQVVATMEQLFDGVIQLSSSSGKNGAADKIGPSQENEGSCNTSTLNFNVALIAVCILT